MASEPDMVCARALVRARQAWFTALIGLPDEGLLMAQESIAILHHYNQDISTETWQCLNLNALYLNKTEIMSQTSQEMLRRADRTGDKWERGWALIWWAYVLVWKQQIDAAIEAGQESLAIFEELNNPFGLCAASVTVLGSITLLRGDLGAARTYLLRGVQAAEEHNYLHMLQIGYDYLGLAALRADNIEQAKQYFLKGLRISQACGETRQMLASLRYFADVHLAQGNLEQALQLLAVVLNHPASEQTSLNRSERLRDLAEKLRAQIEPQLDHSLYQSAWENGQRQRHADVVTQILT